MNAIRETRRVRLGAVVVSADDIRKLAEIVVQAGGEIENEKSPARFTFKMQTSDGSEYEAQTPEVFAKGGILDTKQVGMVLITFSGYSTSSHISVFIYHGDVDKSWNQVEVTGTDATWVNGVTRRIEDAIGEWERQAEWPMKLRGLILAISTLGIALLYKLILHIFSSVLHLQASSAEHVQPTSLVIQWTMLLFVAFWPAADLTRKFVGLWPNIELRTGREYAQVLTRRRQYLWLVATIGVLPIVIRVLYDIVKHFALANAK